MKTIDTKLEILKDLIDPLLKGASPQKIKYAKELFLDIITDLNTSELKLKNLEAKVNGFSNTDDYLTSYQKALDILILIGANDIPYDVLMYRNMRWICEHNDKQIKPFTFMQLYQTNKLLTMFEGLEDRMPESTDELKTYFENKD
jgi:hypothetical protein